MRSETKNPEQMNPEQIILPLALFANALLALRETKKIRFEI
jgi:hypothetical protein